MLGTAAVLDESKLGPIMAGSGDGLGVLRAARFTFDPSAVAGHRTIAAHGLGAFRDKFVHELSTGSRRIVDLLVSSGVRMQVWRLPAELAETRVGAPLTPDDLLDFHLLLAGENWFEQLATEVRRSLNR